MEAANKIREYQSRLEELKNEFVDELNSLFDGGDISSGLWDRGNNISESFENAIEEVSLFISDIDDFETEISNEGDYEDYEE